MFIHWVESSLHLGGGDSAHRGSSITIQLEAFADKLVDLPHLTTIRLVHAALDSDHLCTIRQHFVQHLARPFRQRVVHDRVSRAARVEDFAILVGSGDCEIGRRRREERE